MKIKNIKYIWVIQDGFGDIDTEFFYPEEKQGEMPKSLQKDLWYRLNGERCKPIRLKINIVDVEVANHSVKPNAILKSD